LVNRVVWYVAPALAGARHTLGALRDLSTASIDRLRRGRLIAVERLGEDLRIEMEV
jgi:riboflavin biosynthesis pyrimidine reductase